MKRVVLFSLICLLSGLTLIACQRDRGVQAGNESDTYQPRPATAPDTRKDNDDERNGEMKGELIKVDTAGKMITLRLENGMAQTFRFDDATKVEGLRVQNAKTTNVRSLAGKEGSELRVKWTDDNMPKLATKVEVTELATAKNTKGVHKKPY
jgi:hypothetical protein